MKTKYEEYMEAVESFENHRARMNAAHKEVQLESKVTPGFNCSLTPRGGIGFNYEGSATKNIEFEIKREDVPTLLAWLKETF